MDRPDAPLYPDRSFGFFLHALPSVSSTYASGLLTVTTTADALGIGGAGFDFSVAGYGGSGIDLAPNLGTWRFRSAQQL